MNFLGFWHATDTTIVQIVGKIGTSWVGFITLCGKRVITLWDETGHHFSDRSLDLRERIREAQIENRVKSEMPTDLRKSDA